MAEALTFLPTATKICVYKYMVNNDMNRVIVVVVNVFHFCSGFCKQLNCYVMLQAFVTSAFPPQEIPSLCLHCWQGETLYVIAGSADVYM